MSKRNRSEFVDSPTPSRRRWLQQAGMGFGAIALNGLT